VIWECDFAAVASRGGRNEYEEVNQWSEKTKPPCHVKLTGLLDPADGEERG